MSLKAQLVLDANTHIGESPVWHQGEQALYFVDISAGTLHRFDPVNSHHSQWSGKSPLGCIAQNHNGGFVAGTKDGAAMLDVQNNELSEVPLFAMGDGFHGMRMNDGVCDPKGRFLTGSMAYDTDPGDARGALYSFDVSGNCNKLLDNLLVPNGLAFSPDGQTLYLSDSHPTRQIIWAFDYNLETGIPTNRRVFVDMNHYQGRPDGAAIDSDGCYWIAANDAGLIHRFTPNGKLDLSVSVPTLKVTKPCFGGRDLKTMYITSIRPTDADLGSSDNDPYAGGVFLLNLPYQGVPASLFAG